MFVCAILIGLIASLCMKARSYSVRVFVVLLSLCLCVFVVRSITTIKVVRDMHGRLNQSLSYPYYELCEYLVSLSNTNTVRLTAVVLEMKNNSSKIKDAWLTPDGNEYATFVRELVGK